MIQFRVTGARAELNAASPTVVFAIRIQSSETTPVQAIALQAQIRIEPTKRRYDAKEQSGMAELFGEPSRWGRTQRPLLWTEVSRIVPAFEGACDVELAVPCTYDLELASTKYLHAVASGSVPLTFLFRGTVFTQGERGLDVSMVPWDREACFDLAASTWRAAIDAFFPNQGWLRLHRDVLDSLVAFKTERGLPSWDAVMQDLLRREREAAP